MSNKYSIFHIEGGLGKHIAATAVAKSIKKSHPDRELVVVCPYPEIFLNLDFVDRVYKLGMTPYFYKDFIEGRDSIIFKHEPYFTTDHIHKTHGLIESWSRLYDLEFVNEEPELVFNIRQKEFALNKWGRDKPILLMQTNGGPLNDQPYPYSWCRDMPRNIAQNIADYHIKNGYHVIQICRSQVNALSSVEVITDVMGNMELLSLLLVSTKRVLIDSSIQHAAAALGLPSFVLWVATEPSIFGYPIHTNIVANLPNKVKLPDSYLFDYNFNGLIHECPILDDDIFDYDYIMTNVNEA
jgi:hypothetical protein